MSEQHATPAALNPNRPRPVVLCVLDGWALNPDPTNSAVAQAETPVMDRLWQASPHATLSTYGGDVGLPEGQMGNSEVGHMNLGAGRIVPQDLVRVDEACEDGTIAESPAMKEAMARLVEGDVTCHLMGLVSPGGVHSHQSHIAHLANAMIAAGLNVVIHVFTDGRDTPPDKAADYIRAVQEEAPEARIATVIGRYYAMDRDKRWERVEQAFSAIVDAAGQRTAPDAVTAVEQAHAEGITDEFVPATVIGDYQGVADGDVLVCANFRADRVRELLGALVDPDFDGFARKRMPEFAAKVGMVEYSERLNALMDPIFPPLELDNMFGEVISRAGLTQLRAAETEKYPHVTFFFNGGGEAQFEGEERTMIPSPKVATYDLQPEMSAPALTDALVEAVEAGKHDVIVVNFANGDMVGHTGDMQAAIRAVETVDSCLGRLSETVLKAGGCMLVTADHGNADQMVDPETGGPHTAHTTFPVPVLLAGAPEGVNGLHDGILADVAPTLLALLDLPQPEDMDGLSLLDGEPAYRQTAADRATA
ncbi:MAG: 2,3-bisphosphoglycerate-independent phosphoglycerate mutase [Rhodovibrio sp.]|nr:2,3-bisphosphoglycerate-independent phosphoglycerate mutase [Rhodovibrio sp.]